MSAVPFAVDLHGFQFGAARVDRHSADKETGRVTITVTTDRGELNLYIDADGQMRGICTRDGHRTDFGFRKSRVSA